MDWPSLFSRQNQANRTKALCAAILLTAIIALIDWTTQPHYSLGIFYLFPVLLASFFLNRWEILLIGIGCDFLREAFSPGPWDAGAIPRLIIGLLAFLGVALFISEVVRNRQAALQNLAKIKELMDLRQEAEQQSRVIVESSPAAMLTVNREGKILLANEAAHKLLGFEGQSLTNQPVTPYLPCLGDILQLEQVASIFRTMVEARCYRKTGEIFFAQMWVSTYQTHTGLRMAAIVYDASEQLRDREELGLRQLLTSSRILIGAVSHEVRNLCAAISVVYANLRRTQDLSENDDFKALGSLVNSLGSLASAELRAPSDDSLAGVDVRAVLDELRIILEPTFLESKTGRRWEMPEHLPLVRADRQALLQVLLNLGQNSHEAVQQVEQKCVDIVAYELENSVIIRFCDNGPGTQNPERLFRPFQQGASGTGLGLYVSRAILRTFGGELCYEARPEGCCFVVELAKTEDTGPAWLSRPQAEPQAAGTFLRQN